MSADNSPWVLDFDNRECKTTCGLEAVMSREVKMVDEWVPIVMADHESDFMSNEAKRTPDTPQCQSAGGVG